MINRGSEELHRMQPSLTIQYANQKILMLGNYFPPEAILELFLSKFSIIWEWFTKHLWIKYIYFYESNVLLKWCYYYWPWMQTSIYFRKKLVKFPLRQYIADRKVKLIVKIQKVLAFLTNLHNLPQSRLVSLGFVVFHL